MAMVARPAVLADALIPSVWVETRAQRIATDFVLMFGFAWFVALFAQMAIRLSWTQVPITGQTFAVLVTGGALGANRGAGSLLIYMLMGMIGIPVFAPGSDALAMDGTWGRTSCFRGSEARVCLGDSQRRLHRRVHTRRLGNRVLRREAMGQKALGVARDASRQRDPVRAGPAVALCRRGWSRLGQDP